MANSPWNPDGEGDRALRRPLPFTLYPSRFKIIGLLFLFSVFTAGSVVLALEGKGWGWFSVAFFAIGVLVFLIQLLPNSAYLTVSEEGLEFCSLFRKQRIGWSEITEFGVYHIRHYGLPVHSLVGFNYTSQAQPFWKMRALSRSLVGYEAGLPETYGLSAADLAQLLSELHAERVTREDDFSDDFETDEQEFED